MPKSNQTDPRKDFVPRYLPWLLGGAMLVVYLATLNHWVSLLNIAQVAMVSGWMWQPSVFNPLTFLVTLPFRGLPVAHVPMALNFFSAICGAATLGILARSVAILPHDRTEMERVRERSDFSFLTGWVAWLPPIAAVIFAGLQLGFWECSTNFTGDSFELLWFAIIVWQLLEYRMDEREGRLYLTAFLFGAGITENWAMIAFLPLFLISVLWLRKLSFFHLHFLIQMTFWSFVGLLLFLLLPLITKFSSPFPLTIWDALKPNLRTDWQVIALLDRQDVRHDLGLLSLTSLIPAFIMSIRWSSSFGDTSRRGAVIVNYFMHFVGIALLGVLTWVMFDPPFSPHQLLQELAIPSQALTLYYLTALCLGYFSGYVLLIFGKTPPPSRRHRNPTPPLPASLAWLCPVIVGGMIGLLTIGAALLLYKNASVVQAANDDSLLKYAEFTEQELPTGGAILLCDSDTPGQDQPVRAYLIQAILARDGRTREFPVVDTKSLNWVPYHQLLHKEYPAIWPNATTTNKTSAISPLRNFVLLNQLSKSNKLYYLNPSFGYYFEEFYQQPHGLVYPLYPYAEHAVLPPPLDKKLLADNESYWSQVLESSRPAIKRALNPPDPAQKGGVIGWLMMHLHVPVESNPNALLAGTYYSRSLNYLGVAAQRAGDLDQAASLFADAAELNSNNVVAKINLAFNKSLRAGDPTPVDLSRATADQFGIYRDLASVITANGPFDETSFCFEDGAWLMQGRLMRQAAVAFNRVRQLAPDNLAARLFLAQIYIFNRKPDEALEVLHDPLTSPSEFALTETNSTELNVLAAAAHFQKNENTEGAELLNQEIDRHPTDNMLLMASAQSFIMRGLYKDALKVIDRRLAETANSGQPVDNLTWLYGKGVVCLQAGKYSEAITALSQFLEAQTNNPDALYNRALAYYKSDHLDKARADFSQLQTVYTNNFQLAYGLGEIAWREHQTNEAIRNYRIYVANAPTNSTELKTIHQRLKDLGNQ